MLWKTKVIFVFWVWEERKLIWEEKVKLKWTNIDLSKQITAVKGEEKSVRVKIDLLVADLE